MVRFASMIGRPRKFDREQVLDKAMHLFWRQGYESTGIAQLGEHLGIGRQSLYDTFGDKRGLFLEAMRRYTDKRLATIVDRLAQPGSGLANTDAVLDLWLTDVRAEDYCGCLLAKAMAEFGDADPELAALLRDCTRRMTEAFEAALERARRDGEIAARTDVHALALLLVNSGQGLSVAARVTGPRFAMGVIDALRATLARA